jgi:hypothetical protein
METFVVCFSIAAILGIIVGTIAQSKGYGFTEWWLLGTLFFVVALPFIVLLPAEHARHRDPREACPDCGEPMDAGDRRCARCGHSRLDQVATSPSSPEKNMAGGDALKEEPARLHRTRKKRWRTKDGTEFPSFASVRHSHYPRNQR